MVGRLGCAGASWRAGPLLQMRAGRVEESGGIRSPARAVTPAPPSASLLPPVASSSPPPPMDALYAPLQAVESARSPQPALDRLAAALHGPVRAASTLRLDLDQAKREIDDVRPCRRHLQERP